MDRLDLKTKMLFMSLVWFEPPVQCNMRICTAEASHQ